MNSVRVGWILSALVVLVLIADGATGLLAPQKLAASMQETGFSPAALPAISFAAIVPALLYAIPRTALLGAIGISGFLGGAICTHLRIGDIGSPPQLICAAIGLLAWIGLALRDARIRGALLGGEAQAAWSMPSSPSFR